MEHHQKPPTTDIEAAQSATAEKSCGNGSGAFTCSTASCPNLRSGYATQAARDGHHPTQIAATTRHQDQRVLAGYIQAGRGKHDIAHVL